MLPKLLKNILIALISGLSELLPVSASGNAQVLGWLLGADDYSSVVRMFVYVGVLAALVYSCRGQLMHIRQERAIANAPARRRRRQPDPMAVLDGRVIGSTILPMVITTAISRLYLSQFVTFPVMIALLALSGVLAYIPPYFHGGNRDSRGMSRLDGLLLGISSGLAVLPGLSRLAAMLCVGQLRLCDRKYLLDMALLISVPAIATLAVLELAVLILSGFAGVTALGLLSGVLGAAAAFAGACGGITIVRYLAVRVGFSAFAYISWGTAMLSFLLYLIT